MEPIATTTLGALRGLERGDHLAFLGVPFAKPPIGERRFTAPEPLDPWTGTRHAIEFGDAAPQDPFVPASFRATVPESEDCLSLNVYTPALRRCTPTGVVLDPRRWVQPWIGIAGRVRRRPADRTG